MDSYNRKKKSNGVVGRPSEKEINQRLDIGERIIKNANYKISRNEFLAQYEKKLKSTDNLTCPTMITLKKDTKKITERIKIQRQTFEFEKNDSNTQRYLNEKPIPIGDVVCDSIKQIRLSIGGYDHIIFISGKSTLTTKENFIKKIQKAFKNNFETASVQPKNTSMVHLYIIYNKPGFEHYVSSFYSNNYDVLYTSSHEYCSEIVFQYKNLELVLKHTFLILIQFYN